MSNAPVVFFAYNRPEHTMLALESLSSCEESAHSSLIAFCDGPKTIDDEKATSQVRKIIRSKKWCREVTIIEAKENMGLAASVMKGVTEVVDKFGKVIVLEDDLVLSPYFLYYMNKALDLYKDKQKVMQISGHMFPVEHETAQDSFFLPFVSTWGWATYKWAWNHFDIQAGRAGYGMLRKDKALRHCFDLDGAYPYFEIMTRQIKGELDSWGIYWYMNVFLKGGLTLYPASSLVLNTGFDGSGVHCGERKTETYHFKPKRPEVAMIKKMDVDRVAYHVIKEHLRAASKNVKSEFLGITGWLAGFFSGR